MIERDVEYNGKKKLQKQTKYIMKTYIHEKYIYKSFFFFIKDNLHEDKDGCCELCSASPNDVNEKKENSKVYQSLTCNHTASLF